MTTEEKAATRAGFWRRSFAFTIDGIIISLLFQLVGAWLFDATSGQVQIWGDVNHTQCTVLPGLPAGIELSPGATTVRECAVSVFGMRTASYVEVRPAASETQAGAGPRIHLLDQRGHPIDGVMLDWPMALGLLAYLVLMEAFTGASLGSRVMGIRVADARAPERHAGLAKAASRYVLLAAGFAPLLALTLFHLATQGPTDGFAAFFLTPSRSSAFLGAGEASSYLLHPFWPNLPGMMLDDSGASAAAYEWLVDIARLAAGAWALWLVVEIVRKRDPLYDKWAGATVLLG